MTTKEYEFRIPFKGVRYLTVKAEDLAQAQEIMENAHHEDYDDVVTELRIDQAVLISGDDE